MGQKVTQYTSSAPHPNNGSKAASTWHPASRSDITPLKAQILYACTAETFSSADIPFLGVALGAGVETIEDILQNLIDSQLLLRCILQPFDTFVPTNSGYAVLNKVAARKPEILAMIQNLLLEC